MKTQEVEEQVYLHWWRVGGYTPQVDLLTGELSTCASVLLVFKHILKNSCAVCRNVMFKSDRPDLKSGFGFILWNLS